MSENPCVPEKHENPNIAWEILCKYQGQPWEHCDYAGNTSTRDYLLNEYRLAYGPGFVLRARRVSRKEASYPAQNQ